MSIIFIIFTVLKGKMGMITKSKLYIMETIFKINYDVIGKTFEIQEGTVTKTTNKMVYYQMNGTYSYKSQVRKVDIDRRTGSDIIASTREKAILLQNESLDDNIESLKRKLEMEIKKKKVLLELL